MISAMRHFILVTLLSASALALAAPPPPPAQPAVESLNGLLDPIRVKQQQPALAAAVVNSGAILASGALGVREVKPAASGGLDSGVNDVTISDSFHIGSCTKSMTATVIATLVEDGKLSWDTKLIDVFPGLAEHIKPAYSSITLRQLLSHTAGIVAATDGGSKENLAFRNLAGTPTEQRAAMIEPLLNFDPVAEPGTKTMYSNAGYGIAAAMAERVSGQSWEQLMRERLFDKLQMTTAGFGWPATEEHANQPLGHSLKDAEVIAHPIGDVYKLPAPIAPAGDVHCSIEDFARFAQMHLRGLRDQQTILKPETIKVLHTPVQGNYAFGWVSRDVTGEPAQWHNGSAGTFFTWITIWPQRDLAIVVATNSGSGQPACEEATNALFKRFTHEANQEGGDAVSMNLTSPSFENTKSIPGKFTCDGQDFSPALQWSGAPANAKSYALIMDDPDAPRGTWVHWVAWNITATKLDEAIKPDAKGLVQGKNSWSKSAYGGPCPPSGTHRYFFKLFALDMELKLDATADKAALEAAMKGHIVAQAELMGTYAKQK